MCNFLLLFLCVIISRKKRCMTALCFKEYVEIDCVYSRLHSGIYS